MHNSYVFIVNFIVMKSAYNNKCDAACYSINDCARSCIDVLKTTIINVTIMLKLYPSKSFCKCIHSCVLAGTSNIAGNNDIGPFIDDRDKKESRAK